MPARRWAALFCFTLLASGCHSIVRIDPGELRKLQGFQAPQAILVITPQGRPIWLSHKNPIELEVNDGYTYRITLWKVNIQGETLQVVTHDQQEIEFDMRSIIGVLIWY